LLSGARGNALDEQVTTSLEIIFSQIGVGVRFYDISGSEPNPFPEDAFEPVANFIPIVI
jgi:hypothetical protein